MYGRIGVALLMFTTGCSTAPLAGFMDWHNPSPAGRPVTAEPNFPAGPISSLPPSGVFDPSRPGGARLPEALPQRFGPSTP
jgi:hypothetical protein